MNLSAVFFFITIHLQDCCDGKDKGLGGSKEDVAYTGL